MYTFSTHEHLKLIFGCCSGHALGQLTTDGSNMAQNVPKNTLIWRPLTSKTWNRTVKYNWTFPIFSSNARGTFLCSWWDPFLRWLAIISKGAPKWSEMTNAKLKIGQELELNLVGPEAGTNLEIKCFLHSTIVYICTFPQQDQKDQKRKSRTNTVLRQELGTPE